MGPWVDVVFLVILFLLVGSKVVLQPGVVIALPEAPFTDGTPFGLMAVVLSVGGGIGAAREEIVFFDDERFRVRDEEQVKKLKAAFARANREHIEAGLIIQADQRVRHGTVVSLMNMARDVGIPRVNVAEKPR